MSEVNTPIAQPARQPIITYAFSMEQVALISAGLAELPYKRVGGFLQSFNEHAQKSVHEQLYPAPRADEAQMAPVAGEGA